MHGSAGIGLLRGVVLYVRGIVRWLINAMRCTAEGLMLQALSQNGQLLSSKRPMAALRYTTVSSPWLSVFAVAAILT